MKNKKIYFLTLNILIMLTFTGCALKFDKNENSELKNFTSTKENEVEIQEEFKDKIFVCISENDLNDNALPIDNFKPEFQEENSLDSFQKVSIVRVVDGDTIVVDLEADQCNQKEHEAKVRLIGVDTPESVASEEYLNKAGKQNSKEGIEASEFTKNILNDYEYLYLQKDKSETDQYDRLLRYVWLKIPDDENDLIEISDFMLNGILVKNNIATLMPIDPDIKYKTAFEMIYNTYN